MVELEGSDLRWEKEKGVKQLGERDVDESTVGENLPPHYHICELWVSPEPPPWNSSSATFQILQISGATYFRFSISHVTFLVSRTSPHVTYLLPLLTLRTLSVIQRRSNAFSPALGPYHPSVAWPWKSNFFTKASTTNVKAGWKKLSFSSCLLLGSAATPLLRLKISP